MSTLNTPGYQECGVTNIGSMDHNEELENLETNWFCLDIRSEDQLIMVP